MKISTKGRYALRLMADIAQQEANACVALCDISQRQEISMKYLERIVSSLNKAGLLKSIRGKNGGYMLVKPAKDYTVKEILDAVEGPVACVSCLEGENTCPRRQECLTLPLYQQLNIHINAFLSAYTLEDLINHQIKNVPFDIFMD